MKGEFQVDDIAFVQSIVFESDMIEATDTTTAFSIRPPPPIFSFFLDVREVILEVLADTLRGYSVQVLAGRRPIRGFLLVALMTPLLGPLAVRASTDKSHLAGIGVGDGPDIKMNAPRPFTVLAILCSIGRLSVFIGRIAVIGM